ncbi:MAG: response regulator [Parvibaculum sp.]|nr:response regulator [Parvibaculum sp.]
MPFLNSDPVPLVLLAMASVLLLGVEAWRRASARAKANRADAVKAEAALESLRDKTWELAEREEHYRDLVSVQGDVILRQDAHRRVTYVNDVFCTTFGLERASIIGRPFAPNVPEGEKPRHLGQLAAKSPETRVRYDQRVETANGMRWFSWEEFAIHDEAGELKQIQIVGSDISERKAVEEKLAFTLDEVQAANRAKSQFLAAMSHEIRTPMNGVLGMTNLLLDTSLTPAQRTYAEAVKTSGEALLAIINDILDYSKIEAGKVTITLGPLDMRGALESVCELLSPKAFDKGLEIMAEIDPLIPVRLLGDDARIRQVLINLAGNAIKFTESGGVTIRANLESYSYTDDKANILIEVEDTGIGISSEALHVIFDEFVQADQTLARRFEGAGLGLAISRQLVIAMGGEISVESTPGRGSVFRVHLPLTAVENAAPRRVNLEGQRVLMLDDRPILATSLARSARLAGAKVDLVETGEAMINALVASAYDVILLPIDTAEGAGADLLSRARAVSPGIDALVLLRPQDRDRLPAMLGQEGNPSLTQRRFDGYLVRPVRASSLETRLETLRSGTHRQSSDEKFSPAGLDEDKLLADLKAFTDDARISDTHRTKKTEPEWTARLNVLVAEDNDINALLTRTLLERDGHKVTIAKNGIEVLAALDRPDGRDYDLVLMDLHMPDMDGFATTQHIRTLSDERSSLPIVALTANAMADDRRVCLAAGMDDYLSKPVAPDALARMLATWSDRRSDMGISPTDAKAHSVA